jgi:sugar phosphate isomerase/epimerase
MPSVRPEPAHASFDRRSFLKCGTLAAWAAGSGWAARAAAGEPLAQPLAVEERDEPTRFVHACMTLAYRNFPLQRALSGIKDAGYDHVAWGTQHREADGENRPVMPPDAPPQQAAELGRRCRDMGLEPVKMFSMIYPDHQDAVQRLTRRIEQAAAAGIEQVLTFGDTRGGDPEVWIERFKELGPIAADHDVTLVMKQHGGLTTGTGEALAKIVREVDHPNVWMSYDAGNVFWYLDVDPIPDIQTCAEYIRGFCIKDARGWPRKTGCGPGYGEIDHYRLFAPVAFTGRTIILAYENISPPYIGWPDEPEGIDQWARHAREYLDNLLHGLQTAPAGS